MRICEALLDWDKFFDQVRIVNEKVNEGGEL